MKEVLIRLASVDDAPAIAKMFNHHVRTSVRTFQTAEDSVQDRRARLEGRDEQALAIVAVRDGVVVG